MMTYRVFIIALLMSILYQSVSYAGNCCAPAVPQQGVLGETVTLPQTLDLSLNYEYYRSRNLRGGSPEEVEGINKTSDWHRVSLALGYGLIRSLSVTTILPYYEKSETMCLQNNPLNNYDYSSSGIGDVMLLFRYSPIARSFVNYRELAVSAGVKMPTGSTEKYFESEQVRFLLPVQMQPGTGSWDFSGGVSFYQGFETVDFTASATVMITSEHDGYEFGDQFSWLLNSSFHVHSRLDLSAALSGVVVGKDREKGEEVTTTGKTQVWLVPGLLYQLIPGKTNLQAYFEQPIYQHFSGSGAQLGSSFNFRVSVSYQLPLTRSSDDE